MSDEAVRKLVEHYADGRPICNCRCAWAAKPGERHLRWDGEWITTQGGECLWGCQCAQSTTWEEIATRVVKDLGIA